MKSYQFKDIVIGTTTNEAIKSHNHCGCNFWISQTHRVSHIPMSLLPSPATGDNGFSSHSSMCPHVGPSIIHERRYRSNFFIWFQISVRIWVLWCKLPWSSSYKITIPNYDICRDRLDKCHHSKSVRFDYTGLQFGGVVKISFRWVSMDFLLYSCLYTLPNFNLLFTFPTILLWISFLY